MTRFTYLQARALALTEAITLITGGHVSDDVYEQARRVFDEKEVGQIVWAAAVINTWNRLAIAARSVPGSYQPGKG
ncbi:MAG: carboxymuconolactone decarboxylase family protein, partial [Pseudonocardiaceae bacterium]